jgi:hypothetical protein
MLRGYVHLVIVISFAAFPATLFADFFSDLSKCETSHDEKYLALCFKKLLPHIKELAWRDDDRDTGYTEVMIRAYQATGQPDKNPAENERRARRRLSNINLSPRH